jgi:hypothetical protein
LEVMYHWLISRVEDAAANSVLDDAYQTLQS